MELLECKEAILDAAWESSVKYVAIDLPRDIDDQGRVCFALSLGGLHAQKSLDVFRKVLAEETNNKYQFDVRMLSYQRIEKLNTMLVVDWEWVRR